jgi:hypothetical protein
VNRQDFRNAVRFGGIREALQLQYDHTRYAKSSANQQLSKTPVGRYQHTSLQP